MLVEVCSDPNVRLYGYHVLHRLGSLDIREPGDVALVRARLAELERLRQMVEQTERIVRESQLQAIETGTSLQSRLSRRFRVPE